VLAGLGILGSSDDPAEYFEALAGPRIGHEDLPPLQPLLPHRVRKHFESGEGPDRLAAAERLKISPDNAFEVLRGAARSRNRLLSDLARDITSGSADAAQLMQHVSAERSQPR
jgi:hypothetical protein